MSAASAHLGYERLSRLVDGQLSSLEEARARRHLDSCGRCRSELAWFERIGRPPRRPEPDEPSSGFGSFGAFGKNTTTNYMLLG